MRIAYDGKADALSIILGKGRISRDEEISTNVFAGFDRKGNLIEIQLLEISKTEKPWLTLAAAAKILDISTRTLLRWIEAGKITPTKVGNEYRLDPEDLKKLVG